MQASLRKKMKEHFSSKADKLCVKQEEYHACDAITKSIDKMNERYIASTCRVFNTVYSRHGQHTARGPGLAPEGILTGPQTVSNHTL